MVIKTRVRGTSPEIDRDEYGGPEPMSPVPHHSTSRRPSRCHHIDDPGSYPPTESLPCVLCEIGQRVARLTNRESFSSGMTGTGAHMITKNITSS